MADTILIAHALRRTFDKGKFEAVSDVSLTVDAGQIHALLGPNGAGKTTTVRMCSTLLAPTSGTLQIDGIDAVKHPRLARHRLALVLGGDLGFYPRATAHDNLRFFADLQGVASRNREAVISSALSRVGLDEACDRSVSALSRGMRQRLHLARALLTRPRLLLLDEPTNGLDPDVALQVRETISEISHDGVAVLLTSHTMPEVEELASVISVIGAGRIEIKGSVSDISRHAGVLSVTSCTLPANAAGIDGVIREALGEGVTVVLRPLSSRWSLSIAWPANDGRARMEAGLVALSMILERAGIPYPDDLTTRSATLEQAYLALARRLKR